MDDLCGSQFWDWNKTWDTNNPDFTTCFEHTVLLWIPCSFLWLTSLYEIHRLSSSTSMKIPWTCINVIKTIVIVAVIALEFAFVTCDLAQSDEKSISRAVRYYAAIIKLSSLVLSLILHWAERMCGLCTSGTSFFFWLLFSLYEAVILRTTIETEKSLTIYILIIIRCSFVFFQFLLNFCSDAVTKRPLRQNSSIESIECTLEKKKPSPEHMASFPAQLVFYWVGELLWKGYKKPLEFHDLWELNSDQKAGVQIKKFESYSTSAENNIRKGIYVNILKPVISSFGLMFLWTALLCTSAKFLAFTLPQVLSLLIGFAEKKADHIWKGYFFAGLIFIVSFAQAVLTQTDSYNKLKLMVSVESMLCCAIYRKSLKVSGSAREVSTSGEIVNLMSVDIVKIAMFTMWLNEIWDTPVQIIVATYFLYQELGVSGFVGVAVLFVLIPSNLLLSRKMQYYEKALMEHKDHRVQLTNEMISGMKILKLYAWEPSFEQEVKNIRTKEISILKRKAILTSVVEFLWSCAPVIIALATFATYVLIDEQNILDARKAFVSLALFNLLNEPATFLPMVFTKSIETYVSLKRLNDFMNAEEINPNGITHFSSEPETIVIEDADFTWDSESLALRNINLKIKEGSLVAIVGTVGCGKSSFISALLGEMKKTRGRLNMQGTIAYVPQQPWIQNNTLKDNIIFGCISDEKKYNKVLNCCALWPDLDILPSGDQTEIGEKGINLSGGQKQRVALARAAYCNADIYLLDDPLSAVDAQVGKHIFDNLLGPSGILKGKTRVLVTNGITFLPQVDQIYVLNEGEISEFGTYKELLTKKGHFSMMLVHYAGQKAHCGAHSEHIQSLENDNELDVPVHPVVPRPSVSESVQSSTNITVLTDTSRRRKPSAKDRLIKAEDAETGNIKFVVLLSYMKAIGWSVSLGVVIMYSIYQLLSVGGNIWLSKWTSDPAVMNGTDSVSERNNYLGVYGGLGLAECFSLLFIAITISISTLIAAKQLHNNMLSRILHAPMMFFETTPIGRIVNRFSSDIETIDENLPFNLGETLDCFFKILAILFVISYSTPFFLVVAAGVTIIYIPIQRYYVNTARQLFRLHSVMKSPVFSHFTETLNGVSTIRAFSAQERFIQDSETKINNSISTYFHLMICRRWLAVSLEFLGALVVFSSALLCVIERNTLTSSTVGLSVSYALQLSSKLSLFIMFGAFLETSMIAVERICEYSEVIQEAEWVIKDKRPAAQWPEKGKIKFDDYETRYREGLDPVLRNFTCKVRPGEKIGIVGRTGAGKSSVTLGLFRILEATNGRIIIDGEDISKIGLHDLRSRLTILPQDTLLFTGTLRFNLDPFSVYDDNEIWRALENAHMKTFVLHLAGGLEHRISEDGGNISVGQRQLVCLARAILRKSTILILDEATASVDLETDDLIQETILKEFRNCTVLTIAHRINTIMDSDRVMVLDKGTIVEFDAPSVLLSKENSLFYHMSADAGLV